MRIYVAGDGEKKWCIGNTVKAFKELVEFAEGKKELKLLTVFYDSKKEKRRFKREVRKAGGSFVEPAKSYLKWWETIQARKEAKRQKGVM